MGNKRKELAEGIFYEMVQLDKLYSIKNNPRKISKERMAALKVSIEQDKDFMMKRPLLATILNGRYIVYAGNQRLQVLKELGWKAAPVIVEENLSKEKMDKRIILDNVHRGEFSDDLIGTLSEDLAKILDMGTDFTTALLTGVDATMVRTQDKSKKNLVTLTFATQEQLDSWYSFTELLNRLYQDGTISDKLLLHLYQSEQV